MDACGIDDTEDIPADDWNFPVQVLDVSDEMQIVKGGRPLI